MDLFLVFLIVLIVGFAAALLLLWRYFHQDEARVLAQEEALRLAEPVDPPAADGAEEGSSSRQPGV